MKNRLNKLWGARWPLLLVLAVASFVLGYIGFRNYYNGIGTPRDGNDLAYLTLQLYVLESGSVPIAGVPWQLEVARVAAPAFSATALATALSVAFRDQITDWRVRRRRGHVVLCGLGASGSQLAEGLVEAGYRVVALEKRPDNAAVAALGRRGAVVIVGDATDPKTLRRTRLDRARHLVCLTGSDDVNAEIVLQAAGLVVGRKGPALACLAQIRDPDLCALMRSEELAANRRTGIRVDFFNLYDDGARAMIQDYSPFENALPPEVLVIGNSDLGQSLIAELARQWWSHTDSADEQIAITVVAPDAAATIERLRRRFPLIDKAASIVPVAAELDPLDLDAVGSSNARVAYVCIDDDSDALQAALRSRRALRDPDAFVVVEITHADALAKLLDRPAFDEHMRAFGLLERTLRPDILLGGTYELLARAIHAEYCAEEQRQGVTVEANPSLVPWEQLAESLKESNRDQAAHIGTKLETLGWDIAPLTDWDVDTEVFSDAQVEMLAEMEHERWAHQRRRDGWTSGPKDIKAKKTPYLVDWNELDDDIKELDRQAVRGIPGFLARAGYQIVGPSG